MHAETIVTRLMDWAGRQLHRKQAAALERAVLGAVSAGTVTLSSVALQLPGRTSYRHRCKSVDRLLGKESLHARRLQVYAQLAHRWLHGIHTCLVVVDWSDLTADQRWQWLRGSVVVDGRSVTVYEEVHPQRNYGASRVHAGFLRRLGQVLPPQCAPIVMTDAGFRAAWFQQVEKCGWRYVGRVRNRDMVREDAQQPWRPCKQLYERAVHGRAVDLGLGELVRSRPTPARFVVYRQPPQGRHRKTAKTKRSAQRGSLKQARTAREPWLLASSPSLAHLKPEAIAGLYAQRMRIEQSFRDTKNHRFGQGLSSSRSRGQCRLELLLLVAHLAAFVVRLIGETLADQRQMHLDLQPPRRSRYPCASVMTLARRAMDRQILSALHFATKAALWKLRSQAQAAINLVCLET